MPKYDDFNLDLQKTETETITGRKKTTYYTMTQCNCYSAIKNDECTLY